MAASPTARSLAHARKMGWLAGVVEKWNPHARIRQDLLGFIDLIVLDSLAGTLAVQATSASNVSSRVAKIKASENAARWLAEGNRVQVWGWKRIPKGKSCRYELRVVEIAAADFPAQETIPVEESPG